ncbi:Gfo/Idh/MocA family oxidoreductase [Actinokineospora soli]
MRVGVLGCADVARRRTLPALARCVGAELAAVASRSPAKADRFAAEFGCRAVPGYQALLSDEDIDAVYVALPTGMHAEWAARALMAGKHVLVEKPMVVNTAEASALCDLAHANGLVLMENRMFAEHPQHRVVRDRVESGAIGDVQVFSAAMAIPPRPVDDIRYRRDLGGGALLDVGYYPVHAAMMFLGRRLRVVGATLRTDPFTGVDVAGTALLESESGVPAHLTLGFEHAYRAGYELWGSAGRLRAERAFTPPPDTAPPLWFDGPDGTSPVDAPACDQFARVLERFAGAVRGYVDWRAALRTAVDGIRLITAIRAAATRPLHGRYSSAIGAGGPVR